MTRHTPQPLPAEATSVISIEAEKEALRLQVHRVLTESAGEPVCMTCGLSAAACTEQNGTPPTCSDHVHISRWDALGTLMKVAQRATERLTGDCRTCGSRLDGMCHDCGERPYTDAGLCDDCYAARATGEVQP